VSTLRTWFSRLGKLFGKERHDRELAEELESHLQMHVEDDVRAGQAGRRRANERELPRPSGQTLARLNGEAAAEIF
jgi:hypothetical protein